MNKRDYKSTRRIKLGEKSIKKEFQELASWIDATFKVKTLNIIKYKIKPGQKGLMVILDSENDKNKFYNIGTHIDIDEQKQNLISERYQTLVKHGVIPNKSASQNDAPLEPIWVVFYSFESKEKEEIASKLPENIHQLIKEKLADKNIWEVASPLHSPTVFLYTEKQVKEYQERGYPKKWIPIFLEFFKPHDEFGYLREKDFKIYLYSKESFEKNDEGNWMYFYR